MVFELQKHLFQLQKETGIIKDEKYFKILKNMKDLEIVKTKKDFEVLKRDKDFEIMEKDLVIVKNKKDLKIMEKDLEIEKKEKDLEVSRLICTHLTEKLLSSEGLMSSRGIFEHNLQMIHSEEEKLKGHFNAAAVIHHIRKHGLLS